ncbi:type I-C CRISPR-associated protein Cas8c/Csd1 [Enorma phocaeensis]|uniref:type I-C CRISPR-associated protein Cas8c/Csd1 n=1 Tax=Enorma phocaeensis TaxID=1871019 RepID=UPI0032092E01
MILQELCRLYERMEADPECMVPLFGWTAEKVEWELVIDERGDVQAVIPLAIGDGKAARRYQKLLVPEHAGRTSGVKPYFACDNAKYLLGLDEKRGGKYLAAERAFHEEVLDGCDDPGARALLAFFSNDDRASGLSDGEREALKSSGLIAFRLIGDEVWLHERPAIAGAWDRYRASHSDSEASGFDSVTGEYGPLARLFPLVSGVPGAQSSGASLVSYNFDATESYGKQQANNASLSERSAFAAGAALKQLLGDGSHRFILGDTIVVFWSDSPQPTPVEDDLMFSMLTCAPKAEDEKTLQLIATSLGNMRAGKPIDPSFNTEVGYFVLGISPNAARLAVRFFEQNTLSVYVEHFAQYLQDIEIDGVEPVSLNRLLLQVASQGKRENVPKTLIRPCFAAMLEGTPFPASLEQVILARMAADKALNNRWDMGQRAALLKACLLRKNRARLGDASGREELTVSLNRNSTNVGYLLGRLFAVMERAQIAAVDPTSTIRDRYMGTAAVAPAGVFPTLQRGYEVHIATLRRKDEKRWIVRMLEEEYADVSAKLPDEKPFPKLLKQDDRACFYIAFHLESDYLWKSKAERETLKKADD